MTDWAPRESKGPFYIEYIRESPSVCVDDFRGWTFSENISEINLGIKIKELLNEGDVSLKVYRNE